MFVINGRITARSSFEDVARQLEAGLGPIVKRNAGFRGYYIIKTGDRAGEGVLVFEAADDYAAVQDEAAAWYEQNISPLCEGEPLVTSGEVIVSLEPEGAPAPASAGSGAEARPH
jgi:hypothetical protein